MWCNFGHVTPQIRGSQTLVSLNSRLKGRLGPGPRGINKEKVDLPRLSKRLGADDPLAAAARCERWGAACWGAAVTAAASRVAEGRYALGVGA